MDERSSTQKKQDHDFNVMAFRVVQEATADSEEIPAGEELRVDQGKNPNAVALGRLGGKKGGKARAAKLTPQRRSDIARQGTKARWANRGA